MVVKSPPVAAFILGQTKFRFEFFIIAFNHPAMLADPNQTLQLGFSPVIAPTNSRWAPRFRRATLLEQPLFRL